MSPLFVRSRSRRTAPPRAIVRDTKTAAARPFGLPAAGPADRQLPAGISLCMIVKDEERFLDQCLRSVAGQVDEICIIDTGSADRTLQIAAAFGARIERRDWRDDFAWARNQALALASKRWILVLDADEELDAASHEALRLLKTVPAALCGLLVRCNNLSDDYKGTGVSSHSLVRFFPNNARIRYVSPVHEYVALDGSAIGIEAGSSPISITHHGYLNEIVALRNKSERNLALVEAATRNAPDEPFNWYNLGTTAILCGDPNRAIEAFEKMRGLAGNAARGFIPNALAQLADCYVDRGEFERAIAAANESLSKSPHFANAHFALGRACAKAGRYTDARAAFEAAIADGPYAVRQFIVDDEVSIWKAHSEIGGSYAVEGDDSAALTWFDRALANRPNVVPVRVNRAKALERLGRFDEAARVLAELAAGEPGDMHRIEYVNFLLRRKDYVKALDVIHATLPAVSSRMQAALLVTAAKLAAPTGFGDVETLLERAVTIAPVAAEALEGLETIYRFRGDVAAIERLRAAEMSAAPVLPADFARRTTRLLSLNQPAEAEAAARAGLERAPLDPALRYALGAVLAQSGRKEAALEELARAGAEGDVGLRATILRAVVLGDLGRQRDAIAALDAAIALAPTEVEIRLQRFGLAAALGWNVEAESTLRAALGLGDARVLTQLCAWLTREGRSDEAQALAAGATQTRAPLNLSSERADKMEEFVSATPLITERMRP